MNLSGPGGQTQADLTSNGKRPSPFANLHLWNTGSHWPEAVEAYSSSFFQYTGLRFILAICRKTATLPLSHTHIIHNNFVNLFRIKKHWWFSWCIGQYSASAPQPPWNLYITWSTYSKSLGLHFRKQDVEDFEFKQFIPFPGMHAASAGAYESTFCAIRVFCSEGGGSVTSRLGPAAAPCLYFIASWFCDM